MFVPYGLTNKTKERIEFQFWMLDTVIVVVYILELSVDLGQYLLILNIFPVTLFIFKQRKTEFYLKRVLNSFKNNS